jgi:hypothetical protein
MATIEISDKVLDFIEEILIGVAGRDRPIKFESGTREDCAFAAKEIIRARTIASERLKANGIYR